MFSEHIVNLATQYLDDCLAAKESATLVDMIHFIDAHNKSIPLLEEINDALNRRPSVYVQRVDSSIHFASAGSERTIAAGDLDRACVAYREWFDAEYGKLVARRHP